VDRDDLPDHGAGHFAAVIRAIKEGIPGIGVEALIPDYTGDELRDILAAGAEVIAHNVETVPSLQWVRDRRASFERSLTTLRELKAAAGKGAPLTKTSLLLGLGEKPEEVLAVMDELRDAGVDILVMGQYLRPSKKQIPVAEYISPDQFARYAGEGRNRGFLRVISSPFARTSYHAREAWEFRKSQGGRVRIETLGKPPGSKLIRLSAELEGDLIKTIRIRGDFFASPEESFDRLEMRLAGTSLAGLAASFDSLLREEGIEAFGITGAGVASVLATAVLTAAVPAAAVSEKTEEARGSSL
jgi:lipoic acid synthetase